MPNGGRGRSRGNETRDGISIDGYDAADFGGGRVANGGVWTIGEWSAATAW